MPTIFNCVTTDTEITLIHSTDAPIIHIRDAACEVTIPEAMEITAFSTLATEMLAEGKMRIEPWALLLAGGIYWGTAQLSIAQKRDMLAFERLKMVIPAPRFNALLNVTA